MLPSSYSLTTARLKLYDLVCYHFVSAFFWWPDC